ncbi:MAG TPA: LysR family transcriptional regulator [Micropepsaceae bacterium]|jgi:DNA-binding transcriptional LysR family regulator|nr:LysR family transcriptional regulator [Micropepsaceae bacterium]
MRGTQFAELSAFVAVAEQKSFTRAAQALGISTATLSQAIRSLEEGLSVRLLNRTTRSVSLTAVGERLLGRLRPVLDDYNSALESINDFRDRPCGALRLTVSPPASEFLLAPVLARFIDQYKDIRLEVSAEAALQDIVAERFDAGIRVGQRVERDMVAVRVSGDLRAVIVGSPDYLAKRGTPERPQDLREHNCIRFRFPSGLFPWRFEKKGKRIEVAVEGSVITNDPVMGVRLAADGAGLFYVLDVYAHPLLDQGKLVTVLDDWLPPPDAFYLYYPSRRQNPAALQVLIEFLKANLRDGTRSERRTK